MKNLLFFVVAMLVANLSRAQWEPDIRLTNDPAGSSTSISNQWNIAASGDTVHVVWSDTRDGNEEIYYKRSVDGGLTWGADTRLTNAPAISGHPSVSVSGSIVHVAWCDLRDGNGGYEIYYKRSDDRGASWEADTRLTNYWAGSFNPSIASTGLVVHMVWYDYVDYNWEIYYKRSVDGGITWKPDVRLTNDPANSYSASVAATGDMVHVVWVDYRDGATGEIYYKQSSDGGVSWGQDIRLTNDPDTSRRPCVAVSDSVVHVTWYDTRYGNAKIYYKRSADGGITWGEDTKLTNDPDGSRMPSIAVSGSAVHLVWQDDRYGNTEIFYKKSDDGGLNWGTETRLTSAPGVSQYPSLTISGAVIHSVWTDFRDGNGEIYYKRNPTGGFPVGIGNDSENNSHQQISFYPNPASNSIHIRLRNNSNETSFLTIRNVLAKTLLSKQIWNVETLVDVSGLPEGIYLVSVTTNNIQVNSKKLIITR
ncbi:MAG: exo-alpha-sialidase [Bacteroidota bacterium]